MLLLIVIFIGKNWSNQKKITVPRFGLFTEVKQWNQMEHREITTNKGFLGRDL